MSIDFLIPGCYNLFRFKRLIIEQNKLIKRRLRRTMKVAKFSKKLRFTKETIADLNTKEMNAAQAGMDDIPAQTKKCTVTACQTECPSNPVPCNMC